MFTEKYFTLNRPGHPRLGPKEEIHSDRQTRKTQFDAGWVVALAATQPHRCVALATIRTLEHAIQKIGTAIYEAWCISLGR